MHTLQIIEIQARNDSPLIHFHVKDENGINLHIFQVMDACAMLVRLHNARNRVDEYKVDILQKPTGELGASLSHHSGSAPLGEDMAASIMLACIAIFRQELEMMDTGEAIH